MTFPKLFIDRSIAALVVSCGGAGTTFLIKHISRYIRTNCPFDTDGYKHFPIPLLSTNPKLKVIYIFGDPVDAAISLFRRNYHNSQSRKLNALDRDPIPIPPCVSLSEYAKIGKDLFRFDHHLENWKVKYPLYDTLYLRYEEIHSNINAIRKFLNLPTSFSETFPSREPRQSNKSLLRPSTLSQLEKTYQAFSAKVKSLDNTIVTKRTPILRRCPSIIPKIIFRYARASKPPLDPSEAKQLKHAQQFGALIVNKIANRPLPDKDDSINESSQTLKDIEGDKKASIGRLESDFASDEEKAMFRFYRECHADGIYPPHFVQHTRDGSILYTCTIPQSKSNGDTKSTRNPAHTAMLSILNPPRFSRLRTANNRNT